MEVRLVQFRNAFSPMFVTLFGIVMEVRPVQLEKAEDPMLVTSSPIIYSFTWLSKILLSVKSETITLLFKTTLVRLVQPANAFSPMFVTLFGIVMEVRLVQFRYL